VGNVTIGVASMLRGAKTLSAFVCRGPYHARESASTSARTPATAMDVAKRVLSDSYVSTECVRDTCLSPASTNCYSVGFLTLGSILVLLRILILICTCS
jgi:hypothetical protein